MFLSIFLTILLSSTTLKLLKQHNRFTGMVVTVLVVVEIVVWFGINHFSDYLLLPEIDRIILASGLFGSGNFDPTNVTLVIAALSMLLVFYSSFRYQSAAGHTFGSALVVLLLLVALSSQFLVSTSLYIQEYYPYKYQQRWGEPGYQEPSGNPENIWQTW